MQRLLISDLLLSPPEGDLLQDFDTMSNGTDQTPQEGAETRKVPPIKSKQAGKVDGQPPMSPPDTPATALRHSKDFLRPQPEEVDPTLIPHDDTDTLATTTPIKQLFPPIDHPADAAIKEHIAVHYMRGKSKGDKRSLRYQIPSHDDYRLMVTFVSRLGKQEPDAYFQTLQAENARYYPHAKGLAAGPGSVQTPSPMGMPQKLVKLPIARTPTAHRVTKPATAKSSVSPATRKITTPRVRPISAEGKTPRSGRAGTPHIRQREPKRPIDTNWRAIDDYAPSTALLSDNPRALKIDWDGTPLDLSQDPDRDELHPAELQLASALRLTAARYLTCKRRIFVARVDALRRGKEFKKTDAQQACQIDVNKASKLWMAYQKAGWLETPLFVQYIK